MHLDSSFRILRALVGSSSPRQHYWRAGALVRELLNARKARDQGYWCHVRGDFLRFLSGSVQPVQDHTTERLTAAVEWILRAQLATPDDGVSLGYFPCDQESNNGWRPSYPETTGYIITTLLDYARSYAHTAVRDAALRMGYWEVDVQMSNGAVQGGTVRPASNQSAAAFNTGMVLDGWCSILHDYADEAILRAARRAANFLVNDLSQEGYFRTNGHFVSPERIKTYTCLCAWALYRFGHIINEKQYQLAALRSIEAAIRQQRENGWFANNCLTRPEAPLTHTIGYAVQGTLEVGILADRLDFVDAARQTLNAIVPNVRADGFLSARFFPDWSPASWSCCLTGSAQIAISLYRLTGFTGDKRYAEPADHLVDFLKSTQTIRSENPNIRGALAGSFPLFGSYMRGGYPNWATKYLIDALMLQARYAVTPHA